MIRLNSAAGNQGVAALALRFGNAKFELTNFVA